MAELKASRLFGWISAAFRPGTFSTTGFAGEVFGPPALDIGLPFFGPDGEILSKLEMNWELMTIAAAATSTSVKTDLLPANSIILAVRGINTVAIPAPATSYSVGEATTPTRFGTGYPVAVPAIGSPGWLSIAQMQPANTNAAGWVQLANSTIRITPAGGNPATAAGRVLVQVFFWRFNALIRRV